MEQQHGTDHSPRSSLANPDRRAVVAAALVLLAALVVLTTAWRTAWWLGLLVTLFMLSGPVLRSALAPRLIGAVVVPEHLNEALHRTVAVMSRRSPVVTPPRLLHAPTATGMMAFEAGWPGSPRLVLSEGLMAATEDAGAQEAIIARELSRERPPLAVLDAVGWPLPIAAVVVLLARLTSGAGAVMWSLFGLVVAVAAVVLLIHAREPAADEAAVARTGDPGAVARALQMLDDGVPRGGRWAPLQVMLLMPPASRAIRDFVWPSTAARVAALEERAHDTRMEALTGTAPAHGVEQETTAWLALLAVLTAAAAALILVMSVGGGGHRAAADGTRAGTGTTTSADGQTTPGGCPSAFNGKADKPALLAATVWVQNQRLYWWVRSCDDVDYGDFWVILRLGRKGTVTRHLETRRVTARNRPVRYSFSKPIGALGMDPGMYRWKLSVRDINTNTVSQTGGPIRIPPTP
ncbi:MAG: hypothetical protein U0Y82_00070 [Thermoleophilia bacterium]